MGTRRNEKEKLENVIYNTISKNDLIEKGDKIVVGVSGGPDSMCLLDNLVKLSFPHLNPVPVGKISPFKPGTSGETSGKNFIGAFEIIVAHVNHRLRQEANEEEQYVKNYCEKNGIEFYAKSIDVKNLAHTNKIGTEEAGRKARYEFFDEVLNQTKANKIAVAHNKNDKIETILLHTLRGSGIDGLKGIEVKRGNIIRPLIDCERDKIEKYCEENQLQPKMDRSNFENIYDRNKIRNIVIPYVQKEFNPNIVKTLDRLSEIAKSEDEYMEKQMKTAYQELVVEEKKEEIVLDLKNFNLQEKVIKARLIRYIIKRLFGTTASLEKIHVEDIIKLCDSNIGNKYLTPNKNSKVLVKNHRIYFMNLKQ